jgi:hypothetical protein
VNGGVSCRLRVIPHQAEWRAHRRRGIGLVASTRKTRQGCCIVKPDFRHARFAATSRSRRRAGRRPVAQLLASGTNPSSPRTLCERSRCRPRRGLVSTDFEALPTGCNFGGFRRRRPLPIRSFRLHLPYSFQRCCQCDKGDRPIRGSSLGSRTPNNPLRPFTECRDAMHAGPNPDQDPRPCGRESPRANRIRQSGTPSVGISWSLRRAAALGM